MKILKDQKIIVHHRRHGIFEAVALEDFDTRFCEFYPIATLETVYGLTTIWENGDRIPCRFSQCRIEKIIT